MMAVVFDGKLKARQIEEGLVKEVKKLKKKGVTPKLVSVMVGDSAPNKLYLNIKKKVAQRIGAMLDIKKFAVKSTTKEIIEFVEKINVDKEVHGIMLQLPLPEEYSKTDRDEVIKTIAKEKDVDGLRDDSLFTTPVVRAVLLAVKAAAPLTQEKDINKTLEVVVVGAKGFEGKKIIRAFREMDYEVTGLDIDSKNIKKTTSKADILISVTGSAGIIGEDDISKGAVVIDVGSPKADVDFDKVKEKASFITPVPGGIGPLTVACLMENLVESAGH